MHRAVITVSGRVQGVGFRWWAASQARRLRLVGHVQNLPDGAVEIDAQGEIGDVALMVRRATEYLTTAERPGMVTEHVVHWRDPVPGLTRFNYY